jgi:3-hydroxyisobutyrate dehydrogenase
MDAIAFIGLGVMGAGMAGQLLKAGFPLAVYNRSAERAADLVRNGARLAKSPQDAAAGAGVVFAMVADDAASRAVWLGGKGAIAGMQPGAAAVDCSTLSPGWIAELAEAAKAHGCAFLDAPVTGSKLQAECGQLLFLVGGETEALERARPAFQAMGRGVIHLGPVGSGARMKLINNFLCGVQAAALAEAVTVIEKSGFDRDAALDILKNGAPGSPLVKGVLERMVDREYEVNFELDLMQKDLRYAITEGHRWNVAMTMAAAALGMFIDASQKGWGKRDFSAVVEGSR